MESADEPRAFVCPCAYSGSMGDTYASVLVLGVDGVHRALAETIASSTGDVANTSSYCLRCRRITPSINSAQSIQENAMLWKRQRAFYVACGGFMRTWPKQTRGTRLRNRKKKNDPVDDAAARA